MTTEQAFGNIVLIIMRAQKSGLMELPEAVTLNESLLLVGKALGLKPEQPQPQPEQAHA